VTRLRQVEGPDDPAIVEAAEILLAGGLVAFPTETVYGLGADGLNPQAVAGIYAAKGRPATNPVILHVADVAGARALVAEWPELAQRLAERYWPGPLTLLLWRSAKVPDVVTGGRPTVGLRVPDHPVALALLERFGGGLAAPSANRFGRVSPTTAAHVVAELDGSVDLGRVAHREHLRPRDLRRNEGGARARGRFGAGYRSRAAGGSGGPGLLWPPPGLLASGRAPDGEGGGNVVGVS